MFKLVASSGQGPEENTKLECLVQHRGGRYIEVCMCRGKYHVHEFCDIFGGKFDLHTYNPSDRGRREAQIRFYAAVSKLKK